MGTASKKLGPGRVGANGGKSRGTGHGPMFGHPKEALHFGEFPDGGGYPLGFMEWALDELANEAYTHQNPPLPRGSVSIDPGAVLHLCSGSVKTGVRVDVRPEMNPDIVADCRNVPLPDESFDFIMADPPYSQEYARNLYDTEGHYPRPGQILTEASRLLRPGGLVGLLHHQVPVFRRPLRLVRVYAVHRGLGFGLVAWTLLRKDAAAATQSA